MDDMRATADAGQELGEASPVFFHVMTGSNLAVTDRLMRGAGAQCVGVSCVDLFTVFDADCNKIVSN